jgi:hypothetical protein
VSINFIRAQTLQTLSMVRNKVKFSFRFDLQQLHLVYLPRVPFALERFAPGKDILWAHGTATFSFILFNKAALVEQMFAPSGQELNVRFLKALSEGGELFLTYFARLGVSGGEVWEVYLDTGFDKVLGFKIVLRFWGTLGRTKVILQIQAPLPPRSATSRRWRSWGWAGQLGRAVGQFYVNFSLADQRIVGCCIICKKAVLWIESEGVNLIWLQLLLLALLFLAECVVPVTLLRSGWFIFFSLEVSDRNLWHHNLLLATANLIYKLIL